MSRTIFTACLAVAMLAAAFPGGADPARPGAGVQRTTHLIGYGIVAGLPGTGDNPQNCPQLTASLKSFLAQRSDLAGVDPAPFRGSTAAVIITAEMPIPGLAGKGINVRVSTMCDSRSLAGGTLMATGLIGADAQVYAVAQGILKPCPDGADEAGGPTRACITNGATIVRSAQ